jgi:hypothetical protein
MLKRYNNTIYKLFLRSKSITKAIPSSMSIIRLIVYIKDPKEAPGVDYIYTEEDTEVEETTIMDITTTTHFIRSDAIFITNLDTS